MPIFWKEQLNYCFHPCNELVYEQRNSSKKTDDNIDSRHQENGLETFAYLGCSSPVVPVENEPEDYNLAKHGDLHLLLTKHINWQCQSVFDEMLKCVTSNNDMLGKRMIENFKFNNPQMVSTPVKHFEGTTAYMEVTKKFVSGSGVWRKMLEKVSPLTVLGQAYSVLWCKT